MHSTGKPIVFEFARLIRWKNLLISLFTLICISYFGIGEAYRDSGLIALTPPLQLVLLAVSVVFIMGAGYIINDLMDIETDSINCPDRMVINKSISPKVAIWLYYVMTAVGVAFGAYLSFLLNQISLLFIFPGAALSLYLYSYNFKNSFLIGNVIIASLTAIILLLPWIIEVHQIENYPLMPPSILKALIDSGLISLFFAIFAFLTTIIREWIKDIQDINGDSITGASTMAISRSLRFNLRVISVSSVLTIVLIFIFQAFLFSNNKLLSAISLLAPQFFLTKVIITLIHPSEAVNWSRLSILLKIVMVSGIVSLLFLGIKL